MSEIDLLAKDLTLPSGARFYRCALQVNPYAYLKRHNKQTPAENESSYNQAIVKACQESEIKVIAVTDHYRVDTAANLIEEARRADIVAFPGFEAVTSDGVHLLCLFDPKSDLAELDRYIGDCGIHDRDVGSPIGRYDVVGLLERTHRQWGGVCVAAHVASSGGLLRTLSGQARIRAWTSPNLLACSLPGPIEDAPDNYRPILKNKNPDHERERPIAVLNAQDVNDPDDLAQGGASCWLKMSEISVEGLRQAFLDPDSRIRLLSDPTPDEHVKLMAMTWQGGFLDGQAVHWNENLNVLIGGRGAGKSTVVESLRYVLDLEPLGEEARKGYEGIVKHVLGSGAKVSIQVRSHRPDRRTYRLERTVPNPPVVRDEGERILKLKPRDVVPGIEIYGQHEISELAKSPEKRTKLLERFVSRDAEGKRRKDRLQRELGRTRNQILEVAEELDHVDEQLASLPRLEETLRIYQEAGVEEKLRDKSLVVREQRILKTADERLSPFRELLEQLQRELPMDRSFLSPRALEDLPGRDLLRGADKVLSKLSEKLSGLSDGIGEALDQAEKGIGEVQRSWEGRRQTVQREYEKTLRELRKSSVDGEEFIHLRSQIEELRPLRERKTSLERGLEELEERRRNMLAEWEDVKSEEFRRLERAAKKISRKLKERVRVRVQFAGNREPLFKLLRDEVGGHLAKIIDALRDLEALSLTELADAIRQGSEQLRRLFGITVKQAERLTEARPEVRMLIEELDLPHETHFELNVSASEQLRFQPLEKLSAGQKATAVLLLLLLESEAPLIVDQPEDDLDNRFITEDVVPRMREEKRRRQFIFATHNANILVLGDAELIVALEPDGEDRARIPTDMAAIDSLKVRERVEEILEGGKEAFEMRRLKYGF